MNRKPYKNTVENRHCIIIALAEIMKNKPFNEISVSEVCKRAGVSKNTFYRHFKNLSAVVYDSVGEINNYFVEKSSTLDSHRVDDFITLVTDTWYANRDIYSGFIQDETQYIIHNIIKKDALYFFERTKTRFETDDLFLEFFSASFCTFLRWWIANGFSLSSREMATRIKDYLCMNLFESTEINS